MEKSPFTLESQIALSNFSKFSIPVSGEAQTIDAGFWHAYAQPDLEEQEMHKYLRRGNLPRTFLSREATR